METTFKLFLRDDNGFIVSIELVLISTIAVIGLVTGFTAVRDAVVSELSDVAGAMQDMNQSYSSAGVTSATAQSAGSSFTDRRDFGDTIEDQSGRIDNCISIFGVANEL